MAPALRARRIYFSHSVPAPPMATKPIRVTRTSYIYGISRNLCFFPCRRRRPAIERLFPFAILDPIRQVFYLPEHLTFAVGTWSVKNLFRTLIIRSRVARVIAISVIFFFYKVYHLYDTKIQVFSVSEHCVSRGRRNARHDWKEPNARPRENCKAMHIVVFVSCTDADNRP